MPVAFQVGCANRLLLRSFGQSTAEMGRCPRTVHTVLFQRTMRPLAHGLRNNVDTTTHLERRRLVNGAGREVKLRLKVEVHLAGDLVQHTLQQGVRGRRL